MTAEQITDELTTISPILKTENMVITLIAEYFENHTNNPPHVANVLNGIAQIMKKDSTKTRATQLRKAARRFM